jgi:hypothetical protein
VSTNAGQLLPWIWMLAQKRNILFQDTIFVQFFSPTNLFCTVSASHILNEQCRIFYNILKSFYRALSFIPSSKNDEISE